MSPSKRWGVSEVVSSLVVLGITIAVLGAVGVAAVGSVRTSGQSLSRSSDAQAEAAGLLLSLVSVQSNSTGSYAWVYNYGWVRGSLSGASLDGAQVAWSSSCGGGIPPHGYCEVSTPPGKHGEVTLTFGPKSLDYAV